MSLQAALDLRQQEKADEVDNEETHVYLSTEPHPHKFDRITSLCVYCLGHRASYYNGGMCPGLLNPTIRFGVG